MAELAKNKRYVIIDDVRASYDKKNGSIRISSTDEDFENGFALTLNQGTRSHDSLLQVMKRLGAFESDSIRGTMRDIGNISFSKTAEKMLDGDSIIIGRGPHQRLISWNFRTHPHILIAGGTGSGKTTILSSIMKSISLNTKIKNPQFLFSSRSHPAEANMDILDSSVDIEVYEDAPKMVKHIVGDYESNPQVRDHDTFVFIDELSTPFEDSNYVLRDILNLPADARVHLIHSTHIAPYDDVTLSGFTARIVTGYTGGSGTLNESRTLFNGQSVGAHEITRFRDMGYYITSEGLGCPVRFPIIEK